MACQNGHLPIVEALLTAATTDAVNFRDRRGQTSLHLSVETGNIDIVGVLLSRGGANVNVKNNSGKSALEQAAKNVAIFELMQKHLTKHLAPKFEETSRSDDW